MSRAKPPPRGATESPQQPVFTIHLQCSPRAGRLPVGFRGHDQTVQCLHLIAIVPKPPSQPVEQFWVAGAGSVAQNHLEYSPVPARNANAKPG